MSASLEDDRPQWVVSRRRRQAARGQLLPFGIAAEFSRERPFAGTPKWRSSGRGECASAAPGGEAVEQLQRRQQQRADPTRSERGALVEQALGVSFAQPVQDKRLAGAIAQHPLTSGTVSGLDAQRRMARRSRATASLHHERLRKTAVGDRPADSRERCRHLVDDFVKRTPAPFN